MFDIRVTPERGTRLDRLIDPKAVAWAEAQALNRTAGNVQTVGLTEVSKAMGVPVTKLRKRGRAKAPKRPSGKFGAVTKGRKASRRRLETSVIGRGRPFNAGRWNGADVVVAGRTVATMHEAYGRKQIAKRTWRLKNGAIVKRKGASFEGVFGPGVAQMMERASVVRRMEREAVERFEHHFSQAIDFAFASGVAGRGRSSRRP